jgi:carotenoid phi-ring synthase / carotenoid chi-ring synthase
MSPRLSLIRRVAKTIAGPLGGSIAGRLGGYRQRFNNVDAAAPRKLETRRAVAVIGGGLAGIATASTLAQRGFSVTLFEKAPRIGGKIGGERIAVEGADYELDHGFHAFFRQYYNLNAFLDALGARKAMRPISDYTIVERGGSLWSFGDVQTTPGINLLDLAGKDVYNLAEVVFGPSRRHLNAFLEFERRHTFDALDSTSFAELAERAQLPDRLRRLFTIFARAFFAEDDRLSAAEVVKAFHFYYLSHDHGLLYDYPTDSYAESLIAVIEAHLRAVGVTLATGRTIGRVQQAGACFAVDGVPFDDVVIATPACEARALAMRSPGLRAACPLATRRLAALGQGQRYAVSRIWLDKDIRKDVPPFVSTERTHLLDAVAAYHRTTEADASWVRQNGGSVLELHSYAVPDDIVGDAEIGRAMRAELVTFFPELAGMTVKLEHLRVRDDFTALHRGMAADRPATETDHPRVTLAGDWVSLPIPAMLMEAAFSSGLFAANAILRREGLQEEPIDTVPLRGLLAAA